MGGGVHRGDPEGVEKQPEGGRRVRRWPLESIGRVLRRRKWSPAPSKLQAEKCFLGLSLR